MTERDDSDQEAKPSNPGEKLDAGETEPVRQEKFKRPQNVEELFLESIPYRAKRSSEKLKGHLGGKTLFKLSNSKDAYLVDWTAAEVKVGKSQLEDADCSISINESDLMKVVYGDLNPQILMLSHRVTVKGKVDLAMYVFSLIAPPVSF